MSIAAQLYIFDNSPTFKAEIGSVLAEVAAIGYTGIEAMYGGAPQDRSLLDVAGLKYSALHLGLARLEPLSPIIDFLHTMGTDTVCSSGLRSWELSPQGTLTDYREAVALLNESGRILRSEGVILCYHNHDFEFQRIDGDRTGMDILLEELDPDAVQFCFDAGWAWRTDNDPVEFLQAYADRIHYMHLRDFAGTTSVALGQGDIDLPPLIAAWKALGKSSFLVVEQDPATSDPLNDLRISYDYLTTQLRR